MAWNTSETEEKLTGALNAFKWSEAEKICRDLIAQTRESDEPYPEHSAKKLLSALRRKQCFQQMSELAEAFRRSDVNSLQIQRQYAQSLIDLGILTTPEDVLNSIISKSQDSEDKDTKSENIEARGLLGRMYKQLYVNADAPGTADARRNLQKSLDAYYGVYKSDKRETWHGINAVAVVKRAGRDGISLKDAPDADEIAAEIINFIDEAERKEIEERREKSESQLKELPKDPLPAWLLATKIEALFAIGKYDDAEKFSIRYAEHEKADAFELSSTLRQLKEVWKLTDKNSGGSNILAILQAAHLQRRGASATISPHAVEQEQVKNQQAFDELQARFGTAKMRPLQWVNNMLERSKSIARIEKLSGMGHGTGWLVNGRDFFPELKINKPMVLTNYHVVSPDHPKALKPNQAQVHFEVHNQVFNIREIFWSSPADELDAAFLILDGKPKATPLPLFQDDVLFASPPPSNLFVIGHPSGGNITFSIEDNLFIASNNRVVHYRTPTESGSSGSPVFDDEGWQVVALHHSGSKALKRLDDPEQRYEANEGIKIRAILEQTKLFQPSSV